MSDSIIINDPTPNSSIALKNRYFGAKNLSVGPTGQTRHNASTDIYESGQLLASSQNKDIMEGEIEKYTHHKVTQPNTNTEMRGESFVNRSNQTTFL